ncbi:transglutaminase family protein [Stenotrophobium rhamnosiphilum]|uniref:Transglutaminase n=1 Tax=Stenotrophobium rhamnosiphilum TaxID=2029166 RepID=A0A2T5MK51_9GAMM|nr:transglutaminase family protein [Stenotrophobium rhamnosiphilum]PTU32944.1 transglutaminase [Stenotrophobium rhamnosiphilum]
MPILTVEHKTVYHYAQSVIFNEHRLMCRPRDSHDLRLIETALSISPNANVRWLHDVFGNSIAIAAFTAPAMELTFVSSFTAEHFPAKEQEIVIEDYAQYLPFNYAAEDVSDLGRTQERHYADPERRVDLWAKAFVMNSKAAGTLEVLTAITKAIHAQFSYARREEMGTQTPIETLEKGTGSCRDFALFMMEAVRSLGMAARFVSGYLYDEKLVGADQGVIGGGATHAWVQVFLPGAGWVEFDPTNAIIGGRNLIRVAVARDATQAVPLAGSYTGGTDDYQGMTVEVTVVVS